MKHILLAVVAAGLAGCGHAIYKKAEVEQYCNVCATQGRLECALENLRRQGTRFGEAARKAAEKTNKELGPEMDDLIKSFKGVAR